MSDTRNLLAKAKAFNKAEYAEFSRFPGGWTVPVKHTFGRGFEAGWAAHAALTPVSTDVTELIAEAKAHIERAADAAPPGMAKRIRSGEPDDQRLRLLCQTVDALESLSATTPHQAWSDGFGAYGRWQPALLVDAEAPPPINPHPKEGAAADVVIFDSRSVLHADGEGPLALCGANRRELDERGFPLLTVEEPTRATCVGCLAALEGSTDQKP